MNKVPLLLIGAGGHARSCIDVIESDGRFRIVGLLGLTNEVGEHQLGYEVIGKDTILADMLAEYPYALIAVGQIEMPDIRKELFDRACGVGFTLPSIVSAHAHVSRHAEIGAGTIVMHGAIINANARIGANCIINSKALIEHDTVVGDHCHISTGVLLNGNVHVGASSFIGSGSVVKHGIDIGQRCFVGMASNIHRNLPNGSVFWGGSDAK
jgi:sugar O-acyltransferase (sialic acid O-acetyltransferase NeuD family)